MKINPVILLLFVFLLGCGNAENKPDLSNTAPEKDPLEEAIDWSKLQNRNGDAYIPNTDKPFSGWAKRSYENGQCEVLAKFTNGSVTRLKQWQENGIPKWDIGYTQGKVKVKDVPIKNLYDSNPSLHNGPMTLWYENGQKEVEANFKDGKPDGLAASWYENGQKKVEENYKDGKEDGLGTMWYENGQKKVGVNFKNGKLVTANVWKPNGEKCPITNVVEGNGVEYGYRRDGTVGSRNTYKDGERVEIVHLREDGTVERRYTYKDGELVESVYLREDGTVERRYTYKDGERVED